ncbi:hypothetical protein FHL15_002282 [Xylaria flabelliformis]|uniref:Infection structure specific protein n=1 Tax=Xylaria flabelliformis TaxID=2512241 RepID=A0A553I9U9_9PEZI|nr:hypothetical protein FHL15_002282 [Xylaria flabelliformis]
MYNKVLLPMAALAGVSLAADPSVCSASRAGFIAGAPTFAPELSPYLDAPLGGGKGATTTATYASATLPPDTLADPSGYVSVLCSVAAELPASLLPAFESWGGALLKYGSSHISQYDDFVTECVTTGPAAATITSYLNELLTGTGGIGSLCEPTSAPAGASNGTYPTGTGSIHPTATGSSTLIPTAGAARPTGVIAGAAALGGLIGAVAML